MAKKDFSGALRKTATAQRDIIDDRFARADSVLLGMKVEAAEPVPVMLRQESKPPAQLATVASALETLPHATKGDGLVVRDTFSMPPCDHEFIEILRIRAARTGRNTNKSEVVRAGLQGLMALTPEQLIDLLDGLERVRPGRK